MQLMYRPVSRAYITFRRRRASQPWTGPSWRHHRHRYRPASASHWPVSYHGPLGVLSCRTCRSPGLAGAPWWPWPLTTPGRMCPPRFCGTTCWPPLSHQTTQPGSRYSGKLTNSIHILSYSSTHLQFECLSGQRGQIIAVFPHSQNSVIETALHVGHHLFVCAHTS